MEVVGFYFSHMVVHGYITLMEEAVDFVFPHQV